MAMKTGSFLLLALLIIMPAIAVAAGDMSGSNRPAAGHLKVKAPIAPSIPPNPALVEAMAQAGPGCRPDIQPPEVFRRRSLDGKDHKLSKVGLFLP